LDILERSWGMVDFEEGGRRVRCGSTEPSWSVCWRVVSLRAAEDLVLIPKLLSYLRGGSIESGRFFLSMIKLPYDVLLSNPMPESRDPWGSEDKQSRQCPLVRRKDDVDDVAVPPLLCEKKGA